MANCGGINSSSANLLGKFKGIGAPENGVPFFEKTEPLEPKIQYYIYR